jgi:hypothetical protein
MRTPAYVGFVPFRLSVCAVLVVLGELEGPVGVSLFYCKTMETPQGGAGLAKKRF